MGSRDAGHVHRVPDAGGAGPPDALHDLLPAAGSPGLPGAGGLRRHGGLPRVSEASGSGEAQHAARAAHLQGPGCGAAGVLRADGRQGERGVCLVEQPHLVVEASGPPGPSGAGTLHFPVRHGPVSPGAGLCRENICYGEGYLFGCKKRGPI